MKKDYAKYFWGFNDAALGEAFRALKDANHPRFAYYAAVLLSRCDEPKQAFRLIPKESFISSWPKIKSYWRRLKQNEEFRGWWQAIYESLLEAKNGQRSRPKEKPSVYFKGIGSRIREFRVRSGMSQKDLARLSGVRQPDISKIEEGKKNVTLETLIRICKIVDLKEIKIF